MTTLEITLRLTAVVACALVAYRFKWKLTPTAEERIRAARYGLSITGKSWPVGTWALRLLFVACAIYQAVAVALGLAR
jgi:hypothetical protein